MRSQYEARLAGCPEMAERLCPGPDHGPHEEVGEEDDAEAEVAVLHEAHWGVLPPSTTLTTRGCRATARPTRAGSSTVRGASTKMTSAPAST